MSATPLPLPIPEDPAAADPVPRPLRRADDGRSSGCPASTPSAWPAARSPLRKRLFTSTTRRRPDRRCARNGTASLPATPANAACWRTDPRISGRSSTSFAALSLLGRSAAGAAKGADGRRRQTLYRTPKPGGADESHRRSRWSQAAPTWKWDASLPRAPHDWLTPYWRRRPWPSLVRASLISVRRRTSSEGASSGSAWPDFLRSASLFIGMTIQK